MMNKKNSLSKRYQKSYDSKNGVGNGRIMKFENVEFYSPKIGKNRINIIPYEIKSKNHPMVAKGEMEIGDIDYVMDIFVHKNVGPAQQQVICLKKNYGKPCPICEQAERFKKEGKEDEAKALNPTRRVFYNVQDLSEPEKLKIFETSHYLFEKELIDEARDDEEGGFVNFADIDDGKEIGFRASETNLGSIKYKEFKSFSFFDREDSIPKSILRSAISFDEILKVPTYSESEKVLFGEVEEDEEEIEEEVKPKKTKHYEEEDEEDEEIHEKKNAMKPTSEERVDKKSNNKCPFGHSFGKDVDTTDDCEKCDCWDDCFKAGDDE